ncbi:MAG: putative porin [Bacteroidales bacterium]
MKHHLIVILLFIFSCFNVFSQKQDSINLPKTLFLTFSNQLFSIEKSKTDTDFMAIHDYTPFYGNFLAHLGNGVSATYSLIPIFYSDIPFWLQPFSVYYNEIEQRYFQTHNPFTHIKLTSNTNRTYNEEGIKLIHTQNIKPNLNIAFIGKSDKSVGRIPRQDNRFHYFYGSSRFSSTKYHLAVNYFFSKIKVKENGGVSNLNFLTDSLFPAENAQIYRQEAANLYTIQNADARQAICLNYKNDSLSAKWKPYLIHLLHYQKAKKIYNDKPDTNLYYTYIFNDSTKTYDSLYYRNLENKLGFSFSTNLQNGKGFYIYALSSLRKLYSHEHPHTEQNLGAGIQYFHYDSLWSANFTYEHWFEGYFANNKNLLLELSKKIKICKRNVSLILSPSYQNKQADYFMNNLYTNHFRWERQLPKFSEWSVNLGFKEKLNSLFFTFKRIRHSYYFNRFSYPQVDSNDLFFTGFVLQKTFNVGHFHFFNRLFVQLLSDTLISVPTFAGYHMLYYENRLFKKVLGMQIGTEVFYHTKYKGVSYNPALGSFYNNYSTSLGNYPYINIFVNLQLKRSRFFIKVEHLNYHWQVGNYSMVNNYPLPPRSFKFGILWSFYD